MKSKRHAIIKEIIENQVVETQEELAEALRNMNIQVTQATVSRDIKEMMLIKVPTESGRYRYASPPQENVVFTKDRLARLLKDNVTGVDSSENLIVVKTLPGSASLVAAGLDQSQWPEIIGTIAGDDNILAVIKPKAAVPKVVKRLSQYF
ncbi:MAG: arginine repressor [Selenomonas ruminantium]|nr:arginine repressor [Selenomonas ruminantium]